MAYLKINDSILYSIANAIRDQLGTGSFYKPQSMASAIRQIRTGGNIRTISISANGVYTASGSVNGYNPLVVNVKNSYSYADNGKVVIGSSLVSQTNVTLSENGVYNTSLNKQVTVNVEGGGDITSDATLSSGSQMLSGVTAYARGSKYTGTIPMYNGSINSGQGSVPTYDYYSGSYVLTPSTVDQSFPTAGYIMSQNLQLLSYSVESMPDPYEGSYVIAPSIFSQAFPTAGKLMSEDLVVEGFSVDFYDGSYILTPSTEQIILETSGKSLVSDIQVNAYIPSIDPYQGSYVVTPSWLEQTLETEGKTMLENLVIEPYEQPDTYDGSYVITPSTVSQEFQTADLLMSDNLIVEAYEEAEIYQGLYTITPLTVSQTFPTAGMLMSQDLVINGTEDAPEHYSGSYTITPSNVSQSFPTAGKMMSQNLIVESAPTFDGDLIALKIGNSVMPFLADGYALSLPSSAFKNATNLVSVTFPSCSQIGSDAFLGCNNLNYVSLPICSEMDNHAFENCSALTSIYLPEVKQIRPNAFMNCISLTQASFPKAYSIHYSAFAGCTNFVSLYLSEPYYAYPIDLNITAFDDTPFSMNDSAYAKVYVPSRLVSVYKADSVWSNFSNCIVPLEEEEGE